MISGAGTIDVFADNISVSRSQTGWALDFLRSNPPAPGAAPEYAFEVVARIRCSDAFITILKSILEKNLERDLPPADYSETRLLTPAMRAVPETEGTGVPVPPPTP
jgi:hypothetical protein